MQPYPEPYGGGFPPRDPRFPQMGRFPEISHGNVGEEAMSAWAERSAPLREIAYERTGRAPPPAQAVEAAEPAEAAGPAEPAEAEPEEEAVRPYSRSFLSSMGRGFGSGNWVYRPAQAVGYGMTAAASTVGHLIAGTAAGALKYALDTPLHAEEEAMDELPEAIHQPAEPQGGPPQAPVPAYLLDREEAPIAVRKKKFIDKERTRIREQAAMTGEHPFHPWRGGAG